jgi:hypothetical protein
VIGELRAGRQRDDWHASLVVRLFKVVGYSAFSC